MSCRAIGVLVLLCGSSLPVAADPSAPLAWYEGTAGHRRILHLGVTAGFGLAILASETVLKTTLTTTTCRWCEPPAIDRSVRDALVWNDPARANLFSNIDAYALAPLVGFGMLLVVDHDAGWSRLLDDVIPVAEAVAVSATITQLIKFGVGRQRPFAHFGVPSRTPTPDDNTSFVSGHSSLGFSITAAAGLVCHWRHYWTEPYVWGFGITLSLSTEYLRMGADKHYLTDVLAGGAVGVASGLLVPLLMRSNIKLVPIGDSGIAVAGTF